MNVAEAITAVAAKIESEEISDIQLRRLHSHAEAQPQTRNVAVVRAAATIVLRRRGLIEVAT